MFFILSAWKLEFDCERKSSFLKKRSKKLLSVLASAFPDRLGPNEQKFFGSFFQKRTASFTWKIFGYPRRRGKLLEYAANRTSNWRKSVDLMT
jgi:hypothetical protein